MEYGEDGSQGSYHTPKLGEENMIPVPVMEPTLPPANLSLPDSDQENIPPRMVTPLNQLTSWGRHGKQENSGRLEVTREGGSKVVQCPGSPRKSPQRTRRQGGHWKTRKTQGEARDRKKTAGRRRETQGDAGNQVARLSEE